jgi:hypothetical protein
MTAHDGSAPDADGVPDDDWMSHIPQPQVVAQYLGFESSALDEFKRDFEALHARFRALFVPKPAAPEPAEALGEDRPICDMPPGVGPCDTPAGSRVGCKQLREQNAALRRLIAAAHDAASRLDWGKADAKGCDLRDALLNYERAARPTQEAKPADAASDARVEAAFEDLECAAAAYDRGKNGSSCDTLLANVNKAREALRALLRPAPAVSDAAFLDFVFDDFPGPDGPRLIEVEDAQRRSVRAGEWLKRDDGCAVLRVPMLPRHAANVNAGLLAALLAAASDARVTHYCKVCFAMWQQHDDESWSLRSKACGKCCDNVPMGEQIVALANCEDGGVDHGKHAHYMAKIVELQGQNAKLRLMRSRPAASVNAERMEAIALRCDGCGIRVADNSLSVERPGFALLCPTCMGSPRVTAAEAATPPRPSASDEGLLAAVQIAHDLVANTHAMNLRAFIRRCDEVEAILRGAIAAAESAKPRGAP